MEPRRRTGALRKTRPCEELHNYQRQARRRETWITWSDVGLQSGLSTDQITRSQITVHQRSLSKRYIYDDEQRIGVIDRAIYWLYYRPMYFVEVLGRTRMRAPGASLVLVAAVLVAIQNAPGCVAQDYDDLSKYHLDLDRIYNLTYPNGTSTGKSKVSNPPAISNSSHLDIPLVIPCNAGVKKSLFISIQIMRSTHTLINPLTSMPVKTAERSPDPESAAEILLPPFYDPHRLYLDIQDWECLRLIWI